MPHNLKPILNSNIVCQGKLNKVFGFCINTEKSVCFNENDTVESLPTETTWDTIAAMVGLFPSKGQAKKQNWHGLVEDGWHEGRAGKGENQVIIFIHKESLSP